jgi:NADPH-dependent glutamate synthase beta subunit-like oxidoreductase
MTTGLVVEDGRLAGLRVVETRVEGRKAEPVPGSEQEFRAPLIISSIGSVPESIPGIAMKGEYYTFQDEAVPRYTGAERVFGVGNVVTGQGNIRVSLVHSREVTTRLIEDYMGVGDGQSDLHALHAPAEARGAAQAEAVEERIRTLPPLSSGEITALEQRIHGLQQRVGYAADYDSWIARETPPDLE